MKKGGSKGRRMRKSWSGSVGKKGREEGREGGREGGPGPYLIVRISFGDAFRATTTEGGIIPPYHLHLLLRQEAEGRTMHEGGKEEGGGVLGSGSSGSSGF